MNSPVVICRSNPIDPDPRVEKIARTLLEDGYPVTVIGWDRTGKLPKDQHLGNLHIYRLKIRAQYGSGLANFPALLRWQIALLWWLMGNRQTYQIIHACDFDTILPAIICKWLWKKTVIYDIFDFYADHLRRTPKILKQAIRKVDYWAIHKADGVIIVDEARMEQIQGSRPKICIAIYNSPEDVIFQTDNSPVLKLNGSLKIVYVGLLQIERGLFEIIDILQDHPEWHLDLAGFGGDEQKIISLIKNMPNVTWHGRISYQQALDLSCRADVLFATYDPSIPNHRFSSPNKVFEGMMLGKPIVVAENTNMDQIIKNANCGIIVEYGNKTALANALSRLSNDPKLIETLGSNARRAYEDVYSWGKMQVRLKNFYNQILQTKYR